MSSINKAILIGRLGTDPSVKNLENGATVANFSIATSESWKDKTTGEKKEQTFWHNLVLWRGLAEIAAKYLHKGDLIYVEGKITNRSYEKKEGGKAYITEIVVDTLKMLSGKSSTNGASVPAGYNEGPKDDIAGPSSGDDLPF